MTIRVEQLRVRTATIRTDLARYFPAAILIGYGFFVLSLYVRGVMTLYINPAYVWPTTLAGGILLGLGLLKLVRPASDAGCGTDACCPADDGGCDVSSPRLWPYVALLFPLILAALFPPRTLLAFSANQRGLQIAGLSAIHGTSVVRHVSLSVDTRSFTLQDWVGALSADPNPADYLRKPIVLTGMVLHSAASVPPGYVMVLRYQVTCCIADARAEGLIVRDRPGRSLQDNQWIKVTGTMGETTFQGQKIPVVNPKQYASVKAGNPYMY